MNSTSTTIGPGFGVGIAITGLSMGLGHLIAKVSTLPAGKVSEVSKQLHEAAPYAFALCSALGALRLSVSSNIAIDGALMLLVMTTLTAKDYTIICHLEAEAKAAKKVT